MWRVDCGFGLFFSIQEKCDSFIVVFEGLYAHTSTL
jgi:hypothetical protein